MNVAPGIAPADAPIVEFIAQLLAEKGALPAPEALPGYAYLRTGHVDSLAFIKFVFRIEERFDIRFSEDEMLGEAIQTVGGLVALIADKRRAGGVAEGEDA